MTSEEFANRAMIDLGYRAPEIREAAIKGWIVDAYNEGAAQAVNNVCAEVDSLKRRLEAAEIVCESVYAVDGRLMVTGGLKAEEESMKISKALSKWRQMR